MTRNWTPNSWQVKEALQQPTYPDDAALQAVCDQISRLPPLVTSWEIEALKEEIGKASRGERFILQGGDCAESFEDCTSETIAAKLKILLQMSLVLVHATMRPVTRIGRMAGQYAKPRSKDTETRNGVTLPTYRGDLVNRPEFTEADRVPNPELLLRGYERSALTINFIRSLVDGGFADLHHPEYWNLGFVEQSDLAEEYARIVRDIRESLDFMEAVTGLELHDLERVNFYVSHEGLSLRYEQAQTRQVPRRDGWYNLTTHMPWIGMRTAQIDGAHVEYCKGIRNPVGVKIGPGMTDDWLSQLVDVLHPDDEPGRLVLIHRTGHGAVRDKLPAFIEAVRRTGKTVAWIVDPMHGNTETTQNGIKTRRFDNILSEVEQSFEVHAELGSTLAGIHFELTGDDVTECLGGARDLSETDLERAYKSRVDPRLNYEQALEMAMRVARHLRRKR